MVVQREYGSKTSLGKNRVGMLDGNMKLGLLHATREAIRGQELFYREMRELNNPGTILDDHRDQTGTCRQNRLFLIFPTPICVQLGDPSRAQVKSEYFRKLLDPEWTAGHRETLQKSIRMDLIRIIDLPEDTLICIIKRFGQFLKDTTQIAWETGSQNFQLAEYPSEPVSNHKTTVVMIKLKTPYIPSAFAVSFSTTISFSASRHFFIFPSE